MDLLLLSNSTMPGEDYFGWAAPVVAEQWAGCVKTAAFVPFAGVTLNWGAYADRIRDMFEPHGIHVVSVSDVEDPARLVAESDAVCVGGGNTFHLTTHLHRSGLMEVIRRACLAGKPYLGWSAGSNVACPTLRTTNDMPITEPPSFETLGLIPFQINPHYTQATLAGHGGETRDDRIREFVTANPAVPVLGLVEGSYLVFRNGVLKLHGKPGSRLFRADQPIRELEPGDELSDLTA